MVLEVIMLSVISQTEKDMCSLYVESKKQNKWKKYNKTQTDSQVSSS